MDSLYTRVSPAPIASVRQRLEQAVAAVGFRVLHVHDVQATFQEKGVSLAPYLIVEVCNVGFAKQALGKDLAVGTAMPCRIAVYQQGEQTVVSLARPTLLATLFPQAELESMAKDVDAILRGVVDAAVEG